MEAIMNFIQATGFYQIATGDWKVLIMMIIAFVLLYLAIVKKFEDRKSTRLNSSH